MLRSGLLALLFCCCSVSVACSEGLRQDDWIEQLTDALGWGYGLPDDPVTADYIALLSGVRQLFIEAEEDHRRSDLVAVKRLTNYGEFSGTGWLSGGREPQEIRYDVLVPHNGRYQLSAVTRLPGVVLELAGRRFVAAGEERLSRQVLGPVDLVAGTTEVVVTLPINAGIDSFQLHAPPLPAIAPLGGWQPDQQLKTSDLALTMLQALDLLEVLPETGRALTFEAESAPPQNGVEQVSDRHLGAPSGRGWVRAGHQPAEWQLSFDLPAAGCYQFDLRGSSEQLTKIEIPGVLEQQVLFGPALRDVSLGLFCLSSGARTLAVEFPAWAGVDRLRLTARDLSPQVVNRLLGVTQRSGHIDSQTVNQLLTLLSSLTY